MKKTVRLYDSIPYSTEFDAEVVSCDASEQGEYLVVLDRTLFFPEEGGQTPDQGTIAGIKVVDVQIKQGVITHRMSDAVEIGNSVHGVVDWPHRFSNMQQHSGEHIFSGLVHQTYGYDNVGFRLSDQVVTMDFNGVLTKDQVAEIEKRANEAIVSNLPIQVTYPSKEELAVLDYRSKIEIEGQVRIVTIPGIDVCACCAPHVRMTGEIGMLKVMSLQNYKGGVRISILCGFRALEEFKKRNEVIAEISSLLSANTDMLCEAVTKLKTANQTLKNEVITAKQETMKLKLAAIPNTQHDVVLFETEMDAPLMRIVVNDLIKEHRGYCGVFVGDDENGYRYIIGSMEKDCKVISAALREKYGAKGGGNEKMIQGSLQTSKENLQDLLSK